MTVVASELGAFFPRAMEQVDRYILEELDCIPFVGPVARRLLFAGGKRLRPLLALAFCSLEAQEEQETLVYPFSTMIGAAVELMHLACLLHDDVLDDQALRRGLATASKRFGNSVAILCGDFLFAQAFKHVLKVSDKTCSLSILSRAAQNMAWGELLQLQQSCDFIPQDLYMESIEKKTATLFSAACSMGPTLLDKPPVFIQAAERFGRNFGVAFQILDDIVDYTGGVGYTKECGRDFAQGTQTLPVILAIQGASSVEKDFWRQQMRKKKSNKKLDPQDFQQALTILRRHRAFHEAVQVARAYEKKALVAIESFPSSPLVGKVSRCLSDIFTRLVEGQDA